MIACISSEKISYISKAYGDRLTDKEVNKVAIYIIKGNEAILADHAFKIEELLAQRNATVILTSFTKGKKQLPPFEVKRLRDEASTYIHVVRCLGRIKSCGIFKYQFCFSHSVTGKDM